MRLTDEEILAAFDGDFKQVYFDQKPTTDELMLIKLKLVVQATADKIKRDIQAILTDWQEDEFFDILNARVKDIEAYFDKD